MLVTTAARQSTAFQLVANGWTRADVLAAIDAGIAEVISTFNSSHTFAYRRMPKITAFKAFEFAMDATVAHLDRVEAEVLLIAAVDAAIETIELAGMEAIADGEVAADLFHPTEIVPGFVWASKGMDAEAEAAFMIRTYPIYNAYYAG